MKCQQCKSREALKIHRQLCRHCLMRLVESTVKHSIGIKEIIRKRKRLVLADDGTPASKLFGIVLKRVLMAYPIKAKVVRVRNDKDIKKLAKTYDRIIIVATIEAELDSFLSTLLSKKGKSQNTAIISPLRKFTAAEIGYLTGKGGRKVKKTGPSGSLGAFLEEAERRYPGSKFALLKSSEKLLGK